MWGQEDNKIGKPIIIAAAIGLWLVGLLYVSGIGHILKIYDRTMIAVFILLGYQTLKGHFRSFDKKIAMVLAIAIFQNLYFQAAYSRNYFSYFWLYLMVALFSVFKVTDKQLRLIGLAYGVMGGALLFEINYSRIFAGWNENTLAMQAFFSYVVFAGAISNVRNKKWLGFIFLCSIAYFWMLNTLNSRSAILFSIIELLCVFRIIPVKKILNNKTILIIALLPLIIAILVVLMRNSPVFDPINRWNMEHFGKTLFNGRDEIWKMGFETWQRNWAIGTGELRMRWHNSAISCLVGMGVIGYVSWIFIITHCWSKALRWIDDDGVLGLLTAFIMIWFQQGFDLGIINVNANPLIFTILGLMMARINTLEQYEKQFAVKTTYIGER